MQRLLRIVVHSLLDLCFNLGIERKADFPRCRSIRRPSQLYLADSRLSRMCEQWFRLQSIPERLSVNFSVSELWWELVPGAEIIYLVRFGTSEVMRSQMDEAAHTASMGQKLTVFDSQAWIPRMFDDVMKLRTFSHDNFRLFDRWWLMKMSSMIRSKVVSPHFDSWAQLSGGLSECHSCLWFREEPSCFVVTVAPILPMC